jgi:hypothetical protein
MGDGIIVTGSIQGNIIQDQSAERLANSLKQLEDKIKTLQDAPTDAVSKRDFDQLLASIQKAQESSADLKAPIVLPPMEDMHVRLVTSTSLDRLEEHRADESKAYLLVGAFGGSILGILSNWATSENFTITKPSILLMGLLMVLCLMAVGWAMTVRSRAKAVMERISQHQPDKKG